MQRDQCSITYCQDSTKRDFHPAWGEGRAREDILVSSHVILMTSTQKPGGWTGVAGQRAYWQHHSTESSMYKGRDMGSLALQGVLAVPFDWNVEQIVEGLVSKARVASRCQTMLRWTFLGRASKGFKEEEFWVVERLLRTVNGKQIGEEEYWGRGGFAPEIP